MTEDLRGNITVKLCCRNEEKVWSKKRIQKQAQTSLDTRNVQYIKEFENVSDQ